MPVPANPERFYQAKQCLLYRAGVARRMAIAQQCRLQAMYAITHNVTGKYTSAANNHKMAGSHA